MLELPESYAIAGQVKKFLCGKIIREVIVNQSPHKFAWFWGEKEQFEDLLRGKPITGATSFGGILQIEAQEIRIVLTDGANPRYYEEPKQYPKKSQLLIVFEDESAIGVSVQMYGGIGVFPEGTCDESYYVLAKTKISPLTSAFTYEYFRKLYEDSEEKKLSAKAFLATKQRIPGLGNGVLQDILWNAGIQPKCDMATLSEEEFQRLYEAVKDTLQEMCEKGGRDTQRDLYGEEGGYQTYLSKKTVWTPCVRCGYELHKSSYMGGTVYYCEHCQRS